MVFELQGADRMGDPLDGIGLAVGKIVHRVDAPAVPGAMMRGVQDPVHDRVAQVQVRRGHVDFGPQHPAAVRETRRRACARTGRGSPPRSGCDKGSPARVRSGCRGIRGSARPSGRQRRRCRPGSAGGRTRRDDRNSPRRSRGSSQSNPSQRTSSMIARAYSSSSLAGLVSSMRRLQLPENSVGQAEIETDRLGVADMQIAVGLRGESGSEPFRPVFPP